MSGDHSPKGTKIVEFGDAEPDQAALKARQAEILEKLRSITPDQIENFRGRSLETKGVDELKAAWQKTVWRK